MERIESSFENIGEPVQRLSNLLTASEVM